MICLFTQTYGNERSELFDWKLKDENLNFFIQQFDHSVLSFHNSSKEFREKTIERYNVYKQNIAFNDISYPECFRRIYEFLKQYNFKKLIFLQDDVFSVQKDKKYYEELANYIKESDHKMINLEFYPKDIKFPILEEKENFKVYNTNNHDLIKIDPNYYYFDDGTYAANVDFLGEIYDSIYFRMPDIWHAEIYTHNKMGSKIIQRLILDKPSFRRCNLLGRNNDRQNVLKWMQQRFSVDSSSKSGTIMG